MAKTISHNLIDPTGLDFSNIPAIPLRNSVVFPGLTIPVAIQDATLLDILRESQKNHTPVFVVALKDSDAQGTFRKDYYDFGVVGEVVDFTEPNDNDSPVCAIVHTTHIARILTTVKGVKPIHFSVELCKELIPNPQNKEFVVEFESVKEKYIKMLEGIDEEGQVKKILEEIHNPLVELSFMCLNCPIDIEMKIHLLRELNLFSRVLRLSSYIDQAKEFLEIRKEIADRTQERMTRQQRDQFLRNQIQTMQDELGDTEDAEIDELASRADTKHWSKEVDDHFNHELRRMERFNSSTPEYGILFGYLECMLDLPWDDMTPDNFSLKDVREQLDKDHYGLKDVKERIVEHMAVQILRNDMKSPILCLYGPPGVGKTSIGKSIATAMGRDYARVSLGGLHDEAEIRGHRKTYIGAMPGRIIAAFKNKKGSNLVFVLDEIDKLASDIKGDPAAALLEVLDPEQNGKFHDNYLDVDYDLSKVMFIATANDLSTISRPLLDRMELVEITGYLLEEKVEIARRHLIPKVKESNGLGDSDITFTDEAIKKVIENYTRESGVRSLEKKLGKIMRKIAVKAVSGEEYPHEITPEFVREALGVEQAEPDIYEGNDYAGVVTGLAWTSVGGEILYVETSLSPGKGDKLTLTGNLGNVMKESASLAMQYIKAHASQIGIPDDLFAKYDVHLHVPEGAIPKDGPSAGITMATSIASAFTRRKVRRNIAMTGEITLRGRVLPVGGIKEKILAAKRSGISDIILSAKNRKNIEEIGAEYITGMNFHYVDTVSDVLNIALTDEIDVTLPERRCGQESKKEN